MGLAKNRRLVQAVCTAMPGLDKVLKAVANKRRLRILGLLKQSREIHVSAISRGIGLSFRSTSRHLRILAAADLVETEQRSIVVYYRLTRPVHRIVELVLQLG